MVVVARRDGTLSSTEFYLAACAFSERWRKFNSDFPQWVWIPSQRWPLNSQSQEDGYLFMGDLTLPKSGEGEVGFASCQEVRCGDDIAENEGCSCVEEDESVDVAALIPYDGTGGYRYDLHVVYSASYMVPMLYFRAYRSDGQPLLLDDIEKVISVHSAELLTRSRWTFITQEEHPKLNRPFYALHPCGTSEWMKLLLDNDDASVVDNYLVSWFSVVGQVFGLKLPLEMFNLRRS